VGEKMGVKATCQPIDWDAKDMELNTGKIDCIWNGMSATPEREKSMSLSKPYLNNKIIIMTNDGITVSSKEDLAKLNIGTQAKSAALETIMADEAYDTFKEKVTEYRNYDEVIMDMQAGRIDCMIVDEVLGQYKNSIMEKPFGVSTVNFGEDLYAIGFRKNDVQLTDAVNTAIAELVKDGTAAEISDKWFAANIVLG
ncbi:MAG: transporter substrate-binding domain-containing protein, partial [Oscillospiraceae bacterium]